MAAFWLVIHSSLLMRDLVILFHDIKKGSQFVLPDRNAYIYVYLSGLSENRLGQLSLCCSNFCNSVDRSLGK